MIKQYPFFLIVIMALYYACSSSQQMAATDDRPQPVDRGYDVVSEDDVAQSSKTRKPNEKAPSNLTLADMIRQESGVTVTGQGNNVTVRVRGVNSFGGSDPLYVVNGNALGNNYAQVAGAINPNDIISITVLKGTDAAIYGSRGGNGVIVIRTK